MQPVNNVMNFKQRSSELELMDLGPQHYSQTEYEDCLYKLNRVGTLLGGDRASFHAFDRLPFQPRSILDIGCGGGFFTIKLAKRYPQTQVIGSDISTEAITFAKKRLADQRNPLPNIEFLQQKSPHIPDLPLEVDVITATLVCHHLSDDDLVTFLKDAFKKSNKSIIINDLHRHPLAYYSFLAISPLMFHNRLVLNDGPLSTLRAFKREDWIAYLQAANIPLNRCTITWHWAFRWIVCINTEK